MSEPKIPMLSPEEAKAAAENAGLPEQMAELSIFRILLRHPPLAKHVNDLLLMLIFQGKLDHRLRELVIMRIGWATGSAYEWTQHWRIALDFGVSEADLLALRDWPAHPHWSDADRAVLKATDETLQRGAVTADTWAECASQLPTPEEQLELVSVIGCWRMISQILRSLDVPLEEGVTPWPPDGVVGGDVG